MTGPPASIPSSPRDPLGCASATKAWFGAFSATTLNGLPRSPAGRRSRWGSERASCPTIALAAGMNEYLTRPFTFVDLHRVLSVWLKAPQSPTRMRVVEVGDDKIEG